MHSIRYHLSPEERKNVMHEHFVSEPFSRSSNEYIFQKSRIGSIHFYLSLFFNIIIFVQIKKRGFRGVEGHFLIFGWNQRLVLGSKFNIAELSFPYLADKADEEVTRNVKSQTRVSQPTA